MGVFFEELWVGFFHAFRPQDPYILLADRGGNGSGHGNAVVIPAVYGAAQKARSVNRQRAFVCHCSAAQGSDHINHRGNPVRFFQTQPLDIRKGCPVAGSGSNGQNGHQVWDIRSGNNQLAGYQLRQEGSTGPIPLGRCRIQVFDRYRGSKSLCRQKESGVAPVTFHIYPARGAESAAGDGEGIRIFPE